jgi:hypothetical protein
MHRNSIIVSTKPERIAGLAKQSPQIDHLRPFLQLRVRDGVSHAQPSHDLKNRML